MSEPTDPIEVLIPIYPGVTQLDFTGPLQFLARTPGVATTVASLDAADIVADGLVFTGLADLGAWPRCDVLLVPGGTCIPAIENDRFLREIVRLGTTARYLTSVCTGSLILGAAGLLRGRRAACHWAWHDLLALFGALPDPGRVVRDGALLTGGGVTAGIDFVLTLIAELRGRAVAEEVQLGLEYAPSPPFDAGRPDTAPPEVVAAVRTRVEPRVAAGRARLEHWAARVPGP